LIVSNESFWNEYGPRRVVRLTKGHHHAEVVKPNPEAAATAQLNRSFTISKLPNLCHSNPICHSSMFHVRSPERDILVSSCFQTFSNIRNLHGRYLIVVI
jgi:hypothetical protein